MQEKKEIKFIIVLNLVQSVYIFTLKMILVND